MRFAAGVEGVVKGRDRSERIDPEALNEKIPVGYVILFRGNKVLLIDAYKDEYCQPQNQKEDKDLVHRYLTEYHIYTHDHGHEKN